MGAHAYLAQAQGQPVASAPHAPQLAVATPVINQPQNAQPVRVTVPAGVSEGMPLQVMLSMWIFSESGPDSCLGLASGGFT